MNFTPFPQKLKNPNLHYSEQNETIFIGFLRLFHIKMIKFAQASSVVFRDNSFCVDFFLQKLQKPQLALFWTGWIYFYWISETFLHKNCKFSQSSFAVFRYKWILFLYVVFFSHRGGIFVNTSHHPLSDSAVMPL